MIEVRADDYEFVFQFCIAPGKHAGKILRARGGTLYGGFCANRYSEGKMRQRIRRTELADNFLESMPAASKQFISVERIRNHRKFWR